MTASRTTADSYPSTHLDVASVVHAAASFHGRARFPIECVAGFTLAAFKAFCSALGRGEQASAGEIAGSSAQLVVAVGRAGESWSEREANERGMKN